MYFDSNYYVQPNNVEKINTNWVPYCQVGNIVPAQIKTTFICLQPRLEDSLGHYKIC